MSSTINISSAETDLRESLRLAALARYQVVGTEAEQLYDDIALLAAEICQVPIALISLVDRDRQWFKSVVGLGTRETSRASSFCAHGLESPAVLQIPDSLEDTRFSNNELVTGDPGIRFYAGAPLRTPDGFNLGTLCVIDKVPRELPPEKLRALEALARQVMTQLELRLKAIEAEKSSAALRQAEKLAAVGRLASSIAHEINNPLQAITNLLYMADLAPMSAEAQGFLRDAQEELSRVKHVVTQTLRFHKQSERPIPVALSEIVDSVLALFTPRLRRAGIAVARRDQSETKLLCYAADMRQVMANLIANAMDAMKGGGTLSIRVRDTQNSVVMTIADTGCGMTAETRLRMFEAFYTTKGIIGTGLGLWVCKEILDNHQANVRVRSSQGTHRSGTVFRIAFPRLVEPVAALSAPTN